MLIIMLKLAMEIVISCFNPQNRFFSLVYESYCFVKHIILIERRINLTVETHTVQGLQLLRNKLFHGAKLILFFLFHFIPTPE